MKTFITGIWTTLLGFSLWNNFNNRDFIAVVVMAGFSLIIWWAIEEGIKRDW